ncbi:hypothetical protein GGR57DRAFT_504774 [Xylariaceae sp. FL1272]|nr:hypothetical protein GGR57DRAFT_504774 [Xylariaceae sp. FL1272]
MWQQLSLQMHENSRSTLQKTVNDDLDAAYADGILIEVADELTIELAIESNNESHAFHGGQLEARSKMAPPLAQALTGEASGEGLEHRHRHDLAFLPALFLMSRLLTLDLETLRRVEILANPHARFHLVCPQHRKLEDAPTFIPPEPPSGWSNLSLRATQDQSNGTAHSFSYIPSLDPSRFFCIADALWMRTFRTTTVRADTVKINSR